MNLSLHDTELFVHTSNEISTNLNRDSMIYIYIYRQRERERERERERGSVRERERIA